ncbi:hypothetical protein F3N42_12755 [Marinihelvus fidelis]|uniref:Uncharacterized protein n=1 Tax=Marinihelvus fidelis TaxID=2613842 RepID=A0A5N0T6P8_9GAMM|nr:hypothetical protein [Marinihelvus fidelis]KAA9130552.1 hypothetical protein F3N42_12755 [Marinihelvus fidelis]
MDYQRTRRFLLAGTLALVAILAATPFLDNRAEANYEALFQRALVTFALARTLNGVISAVQGTEVALQPAGVGVTLTPGEILDPVNDLVERFSWIMLGATVSLGIQQVLLEVSAWWVLQALVVVLAVSLLLLLLLRPRGADGTDGTGRRVLWRVLMIALFLRFAVPLTLIANEALYDLFLQPRYDASTEVIATAGEALERMAVEGGPGEDGPQPGDGEAGGSWLDGVVDSLGRAWDGARDSVQLGEKVNRVKERAAEVIEHVIQLSVVFILQTGVLPIVFLWLFLQLGKWLLRPSTGRAEH